MISIVYKAVRGLRPAWQAEHACVHGSTLLKVKKLLIPATLRQHILRYLKPIGPSWNTSLRSIHLFVAEESFPNSTHLLWYNPYPIGAKEF